jgi:hypothetical protein
MDTLRTIARSLLPHHVAGRVCALLIFPVAVLLGGWALAQATPYSFVFEIYKQSALEPDSFDSWYEENQERFADPRFSSCFGQLFNQWSKQAAADKEICDQHEDSAWRAKCNGESKAEYYFLWALSLREFLKAGEGWLDTYAGQLSARGWQQCALFPGGCETLRAQLETAVVGYRQDMTCY